MNTFIKTNLSEFQRTGSQSLIAHLMVITHYVQKSTMDRLLSRYPKLSLSYEGFISRLAERDYSPGELAAVLGISKQMCSKTIKELEDSGLIERRKHPEDSRSSVLSLTEQGLGLLKEGVSATTEIHQHFANKVGNERLQQLIDLLETLCRRLEIAIPSHYRAFERGAGNDGYSRPTRLNLLLPKLSRYFHETLLVSLNDKGFNGLKSSFGQVLGLIRPEGGRIQQIASVIGISKQAIATTAAELEQQGYIVRKPDPADRRQIILSLSATGRQLLAESAASVKALEEKIRKLLGEEDSRQLQDTLSTLYFLVADRYDTLSVLPAKIQQLSEYLLAELGESGAHALAQQLLTITRGKH